jgi:hypothetical protein
MRARGMRAETLGRRAQARVVGTVAMLLLLTGCVPGAQNASPTPGSASPTPDSIAIAGVGDEVVLLNCEMFVPLADAAQVLGVTAADIIDQQFPPDDASYAGALAEAMAVHAARWAGGHQCRYVVAGDAPADGEGRNPEVFVSVLPDGADAFDAIEPDVNDGLNNLAPAQLGDRAFSACRGGEWQGCRAEVLIGSTWLSISVGAADLDPGVFQGYADGVVTSLGALKFAHGSKTPRPDCDALLSPHDLGGAGATLEATGGDLLALDDRASLTMAARARGGLVSCGWSGTDASVGSYSGVTLTILPSAGAAWRYAPPTGIGSPIALEPQDLAADAEPGWPTSGVEALGGCANGECQVTLLAGDVWVTVTGTAGMPGTRALAAAAYTRYAATI